MALGPNDYREGAVRRLEDAWRLYNGQQWEGSVYLAGRAAQAMLRGLLIRRDDRMKLGHDLKQHLKALRASSILIPAEDDERLTDSINELAILWRNDLRFTGARRFRRLLVQSGRVNHVRGKRITGDPEKPNARSLLNAAETVVTKGQLVWRRLNKS